LANPTRGFTVVELLVAAAILLTIAALAVPNLLAAVNRAKVAKAIADIHSIGTDIHAYELTKGVFPNTLADIGYDKFNDPWHNPPAMLPPETSIPRRPVSLDVICCNCRGVLGSSVWTATSTCPTTSWP